jgi:hypothetical protein
VYKHSRKYVGQAIAIVFQGCDLHPYSVKQVILPAPSKASIRSAVNQASGVTFVPLKIFPGRSERQREILGWLRSLLLEKFD